jgi:hypothetical protein
MATIGREGCTGAQAAFGAKSSPAELLVQIPGSAAKMSRAAFTRSRCAAPESSATTRQGTQSTRPVNAAFDQGCRRRRPRSSTAAASSVAPIARAPSSAPNRNITEKESGAAGDITIVRPAAAAPPRRPEQVEMRRARVFGDHPPRDKEHHRASRKCRRDAGWALSHFKKAYRPSRP